MPLATRTQMISCAGRSLNICCNLVGQSSSHLGAVPYIAMPVAASEPCFFRFRACWVSQTMTAPSTAMQQSFGTIKKNTRGCLPRSMLSHRSEQLSAGSPSLVVSNKLSDDWLGCTRQYRTTHDAILKWMRLNMTYNALFNLCAEQYCYLVVSAQSSS